MSDAPGMNAGAAARAATEHGPFEAVPLRHLIHEFAVDEPRADASLPTGFLDLDHLTGGLAPGALWVISGRSGVGKSVLVTDLIRSSAVRSGQSTLLITRRDEPGNVVQRLLAAEGRVPLNHMQYGLTEDEQNRLRKTQYRLLDVPLWVTEAEALHMAAIRPQVAAQQKDKALRLLLVDDVPAGPDQVPMLLGLRQLAVEHRLAVVVVVEEEVRDSGQQLRRIEQVADVALTVHREDQTDFHSPRAGEADFFVTRHRNGPIATVVVHFQGHYLRFVDRQA